MYIQMKCKLFSCKLLKEYLIIVSATKALSVLIVGTAVYAMTFQSGVLLQNNKHFR